MINFTLGKNNLDGLILKLNVKEFNEYLEQVKDFAMSYGFKLNEE